LILALALAPFAVSPPFAVSAPVPAPLLVTFAENITELVDRLGVRIEPRKKLLYLFVRRSALYLFAARCVQEPS
jgi:hypothetical protein